MATACVSDVLELHKKTRFGKSTRSQCLNMCDNSVAVAVTVAQVGCSGTPGNPFGSDCSASLLYSACSLEPSTTTLMSTSSCQAPPAVTAAGPNVYVLAACCLATIVGLQALASGPQGLIRWGLLHLQYEVAGNCVMRHLHVCLTVRKGSPHGHEKGGATQ